MLADERAPVLLLWVPEVDREQAVVGRATVSPVAEDWNVEVKTVSMMHAEYWD